MELQIQNWEKQEMFQKKCNPQPQQNPKPSENQKSIEGFEKHFGKGVRVEPANTENSVTKS